MTRPSAAATALRGKGFTGWQCIRATAHMRLGEHLVSGDHPELATGVLSPEQLAAMVKLDVAVLEPVRMHFGPVIVTSGWRPPALNDAVGGGKTSQHLDAAAVDFVVRGARPRKPVDLVHVYRFIEQLDHQWQAHGGGGRWSALPRDQWLVSQAILYLVPGGGGRGWVPSRIHVACIDLAHLEKGVAWQFAVQLGRERPIPVDRLELAASTWRP